MIDMKDSRIRLCTTYVEDGKKKAVVQVQLTPKKRRVYILTVFQDKFGHEVVRLRCTWHEEDGAHKIDYRIQMDDFVRSDIMLIIYERTDLGTMIPVARAKDRHYMKLFESVRKHKPVRENPYYELFRESPSGRTFICSGYGKSHKEALNELIDKYYYRKGN